MNTTTTMLDAALAYASRGLKVFPLKPKTKLPATNHGFKDATTDPQRIRNWWNQNNLYNVGLPTEDLVVVDVDEWTPEAEAFVAALPETFQVSTGKGAHLYFLGKGRNTSKRIPGIDTRGDGGYVVAPPSIHPDGGAYEVINDVPMAPVPQQVTDLWAAKQRTQSPEGATVGDDELVAVGGRNHWLTRVAGQHQRNGTLTLSGLMELNETRLEEPLPSYEVELIYNSVSRYAPSVPVISQDDAAEREAGTEEPLIVTAAELLPGMFEYISDKDRVLGQPTNIVGLDRLLGGGFREQELVFLSATAKTGKTSLIIQIIHNLLEQQVPVGFASMEMDGGTEILPVLLSIAHKETALLSDVTEERKQKYADTLTSWPQLAFLGGYGSTPIERLERWVVECKARGIKHFFADHAHFMCPDSQEWKLVAEYVTQLKRIVKREKVFMLLVVQPSNLADGQMLDMSRLKGGSAMSQVMNALLVLERYRADGQIVPGVAKLTLDAKRSTLGKTGSIFMRYDPVTNEYFQVDPDSPAVSDPVPPGYDNG